MALARFRFHGGLGGFLKKAHRERSFVHACARAATLKNAIESLGVPHTEAGRVTVNGAPATLQRAVREGDEVEVFPVGTEKGSDPFFLADAHLGALARFLRMLGYDTLHQNDYADADIRRIAATERRIVLSRDRELLKCREIEHGCYVHALKAEAQLREVAARYDLAARARPFTLCLRCNLPLQPVDKAQVIALVPPQVLERQSLFSRCAGCARVYWPGSHYERMRAALGGLLGDNRPMPTAAVVGAQGVIGRYIVEKLAALPDWSVVGLSRRKGTDAPRVKHISVDLLDPADAKAKLAGLRDVTHVFFAAFQPGSGPAADYAKNISANLALLANSVQFIDQASSKLERVVLVTGTKYYGSHLGPFKTPAMEDDPRHDGANYYFDQIDWLTDCKKGKRWSWTELRPQTLCGFAPGTAMSIVSVIAVYAAMRKELGLPLAFPGKAWSSLYQVTESAHFAEAAYWAATEPRCANQAYNITNGDYFRWQHVWPAIARVFEMPMAEPQPHVLVEFMADKAPLWDAMVKKHGLRPYRFQEVVAWPFGDYVFNCDWDVMTSVTKSRQHGFHAVVDSGEMFGRLLRRFREEKIVP